MYIIVTINENVDMSTSEPRCQQGRNEGLIFLGPLNATTFHPKNDRFFFLFFFFLLLLTDNLIVLPVSDHRCV